MEDGCGSQLLGVLGDMWAMKLFRVSGMKYGTQLCGDN